jgi:hypothetical protein
MTGIQMLSLDGFEEFDIDTPVTTIHGRRCGEVRRFYSCTASPKRTSSGIESLRGWPNASRSLLPWADDIVGRPIPAGHVLAEEAGEETASSLLDFLEW